MVKYSGKVSLRLGNIGRNKGYSARLCKGKDIVNNKNIFCTSKIIFGKGPQGILSKKHFNRYKATSKNKNQYKEGNFKVKSKNSIPTCSKDACYTIAKNNLNGHNFCDKHYRKLNKDLKTNNS